MTPARMPRRDPAPAAAKAEAEAAFLREYDLGGRVFHADDAVRIDGLAGNFKVRYFEPAPNGGEGAIAHVFGGTRDRAMHRAVRAERLREPTAQTRAKATASPQQVSWIAEAIAKDGRVEVPIADDADAYQIRLLCNRVFQEAYRLGLRGKFGVRVDKARGVIVGRRKDLP